MNNDSDLAALGAITAAETRQPSDEASDTKMSQALQNTDAENIDTVLVDFSHLQAEAQRAQGLSIAAEKLRLDGKIDILTAQSLSAISNTILGGERLVGYTNVPTKVGLQFAIESLLSEEEAAKSQAKRVYSDLIIKAGKFAQNRLVEQRALSRSTKLELLQALTDFNDEFFSANLLDVTLNDGEINMGELLNETIVLSKNIFNEKSIFSVCREILTILLVSRDTATLPSWISNELFYTVVDDCVIDIKQAAISRVFSKKMSIEEVVCDRPTLGLLIKVAGSSNQSAYETVLDTCITEVIFQLQSYLDKNTDDIDTVTTIPEVIYLVKLLSSMTRAYNASIYITQVVTLLYNSLANHK